MHHALEIHEILLNIFDHCRGPDTYSAEQAILARTCRTFKEPALDLLWEELADLSPLARCLPDACHLASPVRKCYAFSRPLTQTEWDTLQGYSRRIRRILGVFGLGHKSIKAISEPRTAVTEPLFQNLQRLRFAYTVKTTPLLCLPFPSIMYLDIDFFNTRSFQNAITTLYNFPCDLSIRLHEPGSMTTHSLAQLSRTMVTRLQFHVNTALAGQVAASDLPHLFPHLLDLILTSQSLPEISLFLSKSLLPAVSVLRICFRDGPSRQDISAFLASTQISGIGPAFQNLSLYQMGTHNLTDSGPILDMQDFRPCMVFKNLRRIHWNIQCRVCLTSTDTLTLASAWPRLEHLIINETRGWGTSSGITPHGLVRLLKTCPSLRHVALAFDTRDFVQLPLPESDECLESSLLSVDIVDSTIEAPSVTAVADFFARISPRFSPLTASFWSYWARTDPQTQVLYSGRWKDVHQRIENAIGQCS